MFAPAAAHLCAASTSPISATLLDLDLLTPAVVPLTRDEGDVVVGEVLWVDRFGNAQLNVDPDEIAALGDRIALRVGSTRRVARRVEAYAALGPGEVGLVVDSYGLLALRLDQRSAADELRIAAEQRGSPRASPTTGKARRAHR